MVVLLHHYGFLALIVVAIESALVWSLVGKVLLLLATTLLMRHWRLLLDDLLRWMLALLGLHPLIICHLTLQLFVPGFSLFQHLGLSILISVLYLRDTSPDVWGTSWDVVLVELPLLDWNHVYFIVVVHCWLLWSLSANFLLVQVLI